MARRLGLVHTILGVVALIVIVNIVVMMNFQSKYSPQEDGRHRRKSDNDDEYIPFDDRKSFQSFQTEHELHVEASVTDSGKFCEVTHKDAISALKRAKTQECRNKLHEISCLAEADQLYFKNITRLCPIPRDQGRPAHNVEGSDGIGPPVRILYAMVVHGRAFRQVKRLFKALFHTNHYFYFHVDSRSDYLYREVKELSSRFPNVAVSDWRMATIWGGASLLQMLLRMMSDMLLKTHWKWDFFINLSATCYPVQTDQKLESFLRAHRSENFLRPHGGAVDRFIKKQGIDRTFYECDEHMWRLGNRNLPEEIDFDGGSDWICLNRKFVDYVVHSQDALVTGLKHFYSFALLPAESFFHTVLRNSALCDTFAKGNLRLTNWKRKLGCRCQYKEIVDWCGCSPNNFMPEDFARLKSQTSNFFARKFEPLINQEVVNMLDEWLYGKFEDGTPGLRSYWEVMFDQRDDKLEKFDMFMTIFESFSRLASFELSTKSANCKVFPVWRTKEAHYFTKDDVFQGVLTTFDGKVSDSNGVRQETLQLESFFSPINTTVLHNREMKAPANRLSGLEVGLKWDQKERIFRNLAGIIGPNDDPTLVHRWSHGEEFQVRIVWQDPINAIAGMYQMKVETSWVISFHKPTFTKPLRPGSWIVKIVYNDNVVLGEVSFLVLPQAFFKGRAATLEDVVAANNGPPSGLYSADNVIEFDRDANDTQDRVNVFGLNSFSTSRNLDRWIDSHVRRHWTLQGVCLVSEVTVKKCGRIMRCKDMSWSSRSPDPKSDIGIVNSEGRLR